MLAGVAAAVTEETGEGIEGAGFELGAEDVAGGGIVGVLADLLVVRGMAGV